MSTFNPKKVKYDIDQVLHHFGLKRQYQHPLLDQWLHVPIPDSITLPNILDKKRVRLLHEGDLWNEEELKMHFLSAVFTYADLEDPDRLKLFYERLLSATVSDTPLSVVCDALLAAPLGINTPQKPYFFLQEFKKGKKAADDAEGQVLIAMLIAQQLNNDQQAVYGCYLQGRHWYFAVLYGQQYGISRSYDATQTGQLYQILHILQHLKTMLK